MIVYALRFLHQHKNNPLAIPPWAPWKPDPACKDLLTASLADSSSEGASSEGSSEEDPKGPCPASVLVDGRLSEYAWYVVRHVRDFGAPPPPPKVAKTLRRVKRWEPAQRKARFCRCCKDLAHSVPLDTGGTSASGAIATGMLPHRGATEVQVWPVCSHTPAERGCGPGGGGGGGGSGGGGWSGGDGWSGGGGGGDSGGGGGGGGDFGGGGGGCGGGSSGF
jgi:hypothetical protein